MNHRRNDTASFLDLMFCTSLGFLLLFVLSFILIEEKVKKPKNVVESKAEFIITITWDSESEDDVDSYLEDPNGNILYYQAREVGIMHLDRDDLGKANDKYVTPEGEEKFVADNREIITLRGVIPGEYTLNVHMYRKADETQTKVTVTVDKINPYTSVSSRTILIEDQGQEETVCRFTLDTDGKVVSTNQLPKDLVKDYAGYNDDGYGEE